LVLTQTAATHCCVSQILNTAQSDRCATVRLTVGVPVERPLLFVLQDIIAIPTSVRTKEQAEGLGIPLTTLDEHPEIDVAIDGADTVDNKTLALVKGGGGALLREK
jgi:ribose 5-phosphate isomerase